MIKYARNCVDSENKYIVYYIKLEKFTIKN